MLVMPDWAPDLAPSSVSSAHLLKRSDWVAGFSNKQPQSLVSLLLLSLAVSFPSPAPRWTLASPKLPLISSLPAFGRFISRCTYT